MLANIKDMSDEITALLDFNRNFLSRIQLDELYHMKGKLDYILAIKKCMWDIDNIHLSKDFESNQSSEKKNISEASTVASTKSQATPKSLHRSFACSSGHYEAPATVAGNVVTRENIAGPNPLIAAVEQEKKEGMEGKHAGEIRAIKTPDSMPTSPELRFSRALMQSIKRDGSKDCPSPNTLAYATIAAGLRVEVGNGASEGCVIRPAGSETPKTTYRTIALQSSSPKG